MSTNTQASSSKGKGHSSQDQAQPQDEEFVEVLFTATATCSLLAAGEQKVVGRGEINILQITMTHEWEVKQLTFLQQEGNGADLPGVIHPLLPEMRAFKRGMNEFLFPVPGREGTAYVVELEGMDGDTIETLEDLLSCLIVYENRRNIRNTLALIDQNGRVVEELAHNVHLASSDEEKATEVQGANRMPIILGAEEARALREGRPIERVRPATNGVGDTLVTSSEYIAWAVVKGAGLLAKGLTLGSNALSKRITPKEKPVNISPSTRENIRRAKYVTGTIYRVTTKVVDTALKYAFDGASKVAKGLERPKSEQDQHSAYTAAKSLAVQSLHAIGIIVEGFHEGVQQVLTSGKHGASQIVNRRYGPEASEVVADVFDVTNNTICTLVYIDGRGFTRRALLTRAGAYILERQRGERETNTAMEENIGSRDERGRNQVLVETIPDSEEEPQASSARFIPLENILPEKKDQ
ncbi:uncharacterized protein VTP21DRAFT_110 [Calcarisporiella thermophila]|uniref:uncharacterized protein n=1 Tax=Calcarisporiella thermophila TaxID=911321 RepID=UPI00374226F3